MELPSQVRSLIVGRVGQKETLNVDFKWSFSVQSDPDKKKFVKNVVALANTIATQDNEKAYLGLGIRDPRDRDRQETHMKPSFQPFGDPDKIREFNQKLQNIANSYCRPAPNIQYEEYGALGERLGTVAIISIGKALTYPVRTANMGEAESDIAWIRTGPGDPGRRRLSSEECDALRFGQFSDDPISKILVPAIATKLDHLGSMLEAQGLLALLTSKEPKDRSHALRSIATLKRKSEDDRRHQAQVVMGMLFDEDDTVVGEAVQTLRRIQHPVAVDSLLQLCNVRIQTQKDAILINAVEAIGKISSDVTIVPLLEQMGKVFRTPDSPEELDEEFMEVIGSAVGRISARQQFAEGATPNEL